MPKNKTALSLKMPRKKKTKTKTKKNKSKQIKKIQRSNRRALNSKVAKILRTRLVDFEFRNKI